MRATEQYFPVVLFIVLYKVILTFESVDEILKCDHSHEDCLAKRSCTNSSNFRLYRSIPMKASAEPYFPVVLFTISYKVVLTLESEKETQL